MSDNAILTIGGREFLSFTGTGYNDGVFRVMVNTRTKSGDTQKSGSHLGGRIQTEVIRAGNITAFGADIKLRAKKKQI